MNFGGGKDFGKVFAKISGGKPWPRGVKTRGDGGGPGRHDGAEVRWMEVLDNVRLGEKCVDFVRKRGGRRDGCRGGLIGAFEVHAVESVGGVASDIQGGGWAD